MNLAFDKSETKGVRITLKNGSVEDYDPVVRLSILHEEVHIDNTYHNYNHPISQVSKIETYDRILKTDEQFDFITWYEDVNFEDVYEN